jgi:hypothetical protein
VVRSVGRHVQEKFLELLLLGAHIRSADLSAAAAGGRPDRTAHKTTTALTAFLRDPV